MLHTGKTASSPFLAGASLRLEQVTSKRFRAGQIISDKPSGVSSVGMIVSGRVEVYSVALDGKDVQLNALTAGECFGVCNLMASAELETVLRCGEETEVLYIPKAVLLSCMEQDAGLAMRYAALCNRKLQFLLRRIELLTMQSCRGRLIAHLLEQQDEKGVVRLAGSREDLARRLGVSPGRPFPGAVRAPVHGSGRSGRKFHSDPGPPVAGRTALAPLRHKMMNI